MGQTCCRPATQDHDSAPVRLPVTPTPHAERTPPDKQQQQLTEEQEQETWPGRGGALGSSDDDEFWDAEASSSSDSMESCLDVDSLLKEWQEDLHGTFSELKPQLDEVERCHGHVVPPEIERAAARLEIDVEGPKKKLDISAAAALRVKAAPLEDSATLRAWDALREFLFQQQQQQGETAQVDPALFCMAGAPLVAEIRKLVSLGRILEAHLRLKQLCKQAGASPAAIFDGHPPEDLGFDVEALEDDVRAAHAALEGLEDDQGWMVSREGAFRVLYRHKKSTTQHALKFHAVFPHPAGHILALAHEWDLVPTWNRFAVDSRKLAEPSIFESYVYGAQWMMRPFRTMQAVARARGFDLADSHRCLLILIGDADPQNLPQGHAPLPEAFAKRRLVNLLPGSCIKLRPLPPGPDGVPRTDAHMVVHLDPHIPYVPGALVNFVLGVLAPYVYNQMNKVLTKTFADEAAALPTRVREQPELYGYLEERLAEFAEELKQQ